MSWTKKLRGLLGPPEGERSLAGRTALVADESAAIQKAAAMLLEEQGCAVVMASDGDAAIAELGSRRVDVVLVATTLPKRSGYDVCEWLKGRPESAGTRVILLKPLGEPLEERRCGSGRWDGIVQKPFFPPQLVAAVRKVVDEATSG